ncbi:MAG: selenobiotic family radical SAM modification target peptide [Nitrospirota bacterium]|nr:MAG: selenobiotic family radical SAM modification target peptide [Nitrospirota bacterium]
MNRDVLKKLLAGISIAGLLSGAGLVAPSTSFGASHTKSG